MSINKFELDTEEGCKIWETFLDKQIDRLVQIEPSLRSSMVARISDIHPIYSSIIEDAISVRILGADGRLNQSYIIARAFLERLINYCFLQISSQEEYGNFIDYSDNKAGRRLSRSMMIDGKIKAKVEYAEGKYELPEHVKKAIVKFTSENGREKTRWTKLGLPERAAVIEKESEKNGLFMHLLIIYADASEALHGTLYGSLFHFGIYDPGSVPTDQASLDKHRYSTLSMLYLVFGSAIDTLFSFLNEIGERSVENSSCSSDLEFKIAAVKTGLVQAKIL